MNAARLRRSADIAAVRSAGRMLRDAAFSVRARPNALGAVRLAVSAPRTVGTAVERNRARRRVREAFRAAVTSADSRGCDLVVTARREALSADFAALRAAASAALASAG